MLTCVWLKALEDLRQELKVANVPNVQVDVLPADLSPPATRTLPAQRLVVMRPQAGHACAQLPPATSACLPQQACCCMLAALVKT